MNEILCPHCEQNMSSKIVRTTKEGKHLLMKEITDSHMINILRYVVANEWIVWLQASKFIRELKKRKAWNKWINDMLQKINERYEETIYNYYDPFDL